MHCYTFATAALALAAGVAGEVITVEVGKGGKKFSPDNIKAAEGDIVEFNFNGQHSVVASDFDSPCNPASDGGFFSGVMKSGSFSVQIEDASSPVFIYCSVSSHCQGGMVGVINEGADSLDDYKSDASDAGDSVSPDSPFGGADPTTTDGGADPTSTPDAAAHLAGSGAAAAGFAVIMGGLLAI